MNNIDETKAWLRDINEFVKLLVPEIRAQAFEILAGKRGSGNMNAESAGTGQTDIEEYFATVSDAKPSDAALAIAGFWYSQYGSAPFTRQWVEDTAAQVGLTIPSRVDMTFRQAKRNGKPLFQASKGEFAVTVHGERYLKQELGISKGTQAPPSGGDE